MKNLNLILNFEVNNEKPLSAVIIKIDGKNNQVLLSGKESLVKKTNPMPNNMDGNKNNPILFLSLKYAKNPNKKIIK